MDKSSKNSRKLLATCNQFARAVIVVDPTTLQAISRIETIAEPHVVVHDARRGLLYVAITYRSGYYDKKGEHGREIVIIDPATATTKRTIDISPEAGPHDLVIDPARDRLYVTCESDGGCLLVFDLETFERVGKIPTRAPGPHWLAVLPNGSKGYTGNKEATHVSVLDLDRLENGGEIPMPTGSEDLTVSPNGEFLYANDRKSPLVHVVRTDTDKEIGTVKLPSNPHRVLLTATGHLVVSHFRHSKDASTWDFSKPNPGSISVTDAKTLRVVDEIQVGTGPLGLAASDDGATVFVNNINDGTMTVIDAERGKATGLVTLAAGSHDVILFDAAAP